MFEFKEIKYGYINIYLLKYSEFEMENYFDILNNIEKFKFNQYKSKNRKREFLSVRILKNHYLGNKTIKYNDIGAPYIDNNHFISISHTKNYVCIAYNEQHKIGVDIEFIRFNIKKIKSKFISSTEEYYFDTNSEYELTKLWCLKETLFIKYQI